MSGDPEPFTPHFVQNVVYFMKLSAADEPKVTSKPPPNEGRLLSVASHWVRLTTGTQGTRILKVGALPFRSDDNI